MFDAVFWHEPRDQGGHISGVCRSQHGNLAPLIDTLKIEPCGFYTFPTALTRLGSCWRLATPDWT